MGLSILVNGLEVMKIFKIRRWLIYVKNTRSNSKPVNRQPSNLNLRLILNLLTENFLEIIFSPRVKYLLKKFLRQIFLKSRNVFEKEFAMYGNVVAKMSSG